MAESMHCLLNHRSKLCEYRKSVDKHRLHSVYRIWLASKEVVVDACCFEMNAAYKVNNMFFIVE